MATPFPPRCAARFRQERLLGQGGYGAVFRAFDTKLERPCVVKLLHLGPQAGDEAVRRFRNEARVTAQLRHPAVVAVVDHDVEDGVPWIAYELLEGRDLRAALEAGGLALADALAAVHAVCGALDEAHRQAILHRDLKPENVMMLAAGGFKLMDFGIAKWSGRSTVQTEAGTVIGTPAYLAPELWRGESASPASDLYAIGVMLHELSTGSPPFSGDLSAVVSGHLDDEPPRPSRLRPELPKALDGLVGMLLAKRPGERPESAAAVAAEIEKLTSGAKLASTAVADLAGARERALGTRAGTRPAAEVAVRPAASERRPLAAAGGAVCVALLLLAAALRGPAEPTPAPAPSPSASASADPAAELRRRYPRPLDLLAPECGFVGDEKQCLALIRSKSPDDQVRGKLGLAALLARKKALSKIEYREARYALDYITKVAPAGTARPCADRIRAFLNIRQREALAEPEQIYRELHRKDPGDRPALVGLALIHGLLRYTGENAQRVYRQALELYPESMDLRGAMASALMATGDFEGARREVEVLERVAPENHLTRVKRCRLLIADGRREDASRMAGPLLSECLKRDKPLDGIVVADLGWILFELNGFDEMARLAGDALDRDDDNEGYFELRAYALLKQKKMRQAVDEASRFLERKPNSHIVLIHRARALIEEGNFGDAKRDLDRAIEQLPPAHRPYGMAVELLNRQGKHDEAIAQARQFNVETFEVYLQAGIAHFRRRKPGDLDKAVKQLTKAIALEPGSAAIHCHRAEAYAELRKFDLARADVERAAKLAPLADYIPRTRKLIEDAARQK
jgi:tetratricopeptide (TPR) repeat protein